MGLKLKPAFKDVVIGFNNSTAPLGKRNDLHILFEQAKKNGITRHLNMFEETPDEKELDKIKTDAFQKNSTAASNLTSVKPDAAKDNKDQPKEQPKDQPKEQKQ